MDENTDSQSEKHILPMEHKTIITPSDSFIQEVKSTQTSNPPNNDQDPNLTTSSKVGPSPEDPNLTTSSKVGPSPQGSTFTQPSTTDSTYSQPTINQQLPNPPQIITNSSSSVDNMPVIMSSGGSEFSDSNQTYNNNDQDIEYSSNPFVNLSQGLSRILFTNSVSTLFGSIFTFAGIAIIMFIALFLIYVKSVSLLIVLSIILFFIYLLCSVLITGVISSIAVASYKGETENFLTSLGNSFKKFFSILLLEIILIVLTVIGLFLFIIPAVIFISRSYLAYIVMFDENLGPIEALKRSFALTKNHSIETFSSLLIVNLFAPSLLLTVPIASGLLMGRYSQLKQIEKNQTSTETHWLNYAMPIIYLVFVGLYILFILFIFNYAKNHSSSSGLSITTNSNTSGFGDKINKTMSSNQNLSHQKTIALNNAHEAAAQSTLAIAQSMLAEYYADNSSYPANITDLDNWIADSQVSMDTQFSRIFVSPNYSYTVTPTGCGDTVASGGAITPGPTCTGYSLSASGSMWGSSTGLTVTN